MKIEIYNDKAVIDGTTYVPIHPNGTPESEDEDDVYELAFRKLGPIKPEPLITGNNPPSSTPTAEIAEQRREFFLDIKYYKKIYASKEASKNDGYPPLIHVTELRPNEKVVSREELIRAMYPIHMSVIMENIILKALGFDTKERGDGK